MITTVFSHAALKTVVISGDPVTAQP